MDEEIIAPETQDETTTSESVDDSEVTSEALSETIEEIKEIQLGSLELCLEEVTKLQNEQQKMTQLMSEIQTSQKELLTRLTSSTKPSPDSQPSTPETLPETAEMETPQNVEVENQEPKISQRTRRLI